LAATTLLTKAERQAIETLSAKRTEKEQGGVDQTEFLNDQLLSTECSALNWPEPGMSEKTGTPSGDSTISLVTGGGLEIGPSQASSFSSRPCPSLLIRFPTAVRTRDLPPLSNFRVTFVSSPFSPKSSSWSNSMSTRAKQKKAQLRQETETLNKKRQQIAECEALEDAMTIVPMFKKFDRNGIRATLLAMQKCPEELEEFTFNLIETHMKTLYEETWGWEPDEKAAELYEPPARFIFAVPDVDPPEPFGFIHYRFEMDRTETALYINDIHVRDDVMGRGLGRVLLQAVEFLALKLRLDAVIVTVL
jgi:GNAT superfamily N-acetyltransferase